MGILNITERAGSGAVITVVGVGGGGTNAVNRMIEEQLKGTRYITIDTDAFSLKNSLSEVKINIGETLTSGRGTGGDHEKGIQAAKERFDDIKELISGTDMLFIAAGFGRGTGTGASQVVAEVARSLGILTIGVITRPFDFEGKKAKSKTEAGLQALEKTTDTLITINNQRLIDLARPEDPILKTHKMVDDVLFRAVRGITDVITSPRGKTLINTDFADVKSILKNAGYALMGTGTGSGEGRHIKAIKEAMHSPLLEDVCIREARALLVNFTGGEKLSLLEVDKAINFVTKEATEADNVFFGCVIDPDMGENVDITLIASGFSGKAKPSPYAKIKRDKKQEKIDLKTPAFMRRKKPEQGYLF